MFTLDIARMPSVQNLGQALLFEESDDEAEDEGEDWQPVSPRNFTMQPEGLATPEYTQVSEPPARVFSKYQIFQVF